MLIIIKDRQMSKYSSTCIEQCDDESFQRASAVLCSIVNAINRITVDPIGSVNTIVNNYASSGVLATAINPLVPPFFSTYCGKENIRKFLLLYATNPGEINQHVKIRNKYWDCPTKTLTVEWTWTATLTQDRTFVYGIKGMRTGSRSINISASGESGATTKCQFSDKMPLVPVTTLCSGTAYQQDDFNVLRFDCNYKLTYFRLYFDSQQYISTYTNNYPPVCNIKCNKLNGIIPCTSRDRDLATEVLLRLNYATDLLSTNPVLAVDLVISEFAPDAVWSKTSGNLVGLKQMRESFLKYALNPGETDQTVITKAIYWDCDSRSLSVEKVWSSVLTAPQVFGTKILKAGDLYRQNNNTIIRFNCDYKIIYYREYFDNDQYQTISSDPICLTRKKKLKK